MTYRYLVESDVPLDLIGNGTSDTPRLQPAMWGRGLDYNGKTLSGYVPNAEISNPTLTAYRLRKDDPR